MSRPEPQASATRRTTHRDAGNSPTRPRINPLATWSLVLSLINFFGLTSLVGIILGIVAIRQVKNTGERGRGIAIAGIIIGSVLFTTTAACAIILATSLGATN